MLNTLKIFLRSFRQQAAINTLSISGLSIGIAISLLMGLWTINEFSFDNFNEDSASIYRIGREGFINNETIHVASCFSPLAADCHASLPEVKESLRITLHSNEELEVNLIKGFETLLFTDSNFFNFFNYPLKYGNKNTCLKIASSIVISSKLSQKYFPNINPIGKTISLRKKEWIITGVMKNTPSNSHLQFDGVVPIHAFPKIAQRAYGSSDNYMTYIKVFNDFKPETLSKKITKLTHDRAPFLKDIPIKHFIQPLKDIHFGSSGFRFDKAISGDKRLVLILTFMALSILIIACINFTNLFISTSFLRVKSLAIKKANGAKQGQLIRELFYETMIYVFISLLLGLLMTTLALPIFNKLASSQLNINFYDYRFYTFLFTIGIFTTFLAGSFPAFSMAKMNVIIALKGKSKAKSITIIQKFLVIIQFVVSLILVISVITIKKQVYYMQHADLGFEKDHVVFLNAIGSFSKDYETIKQELEKSPHIQEVTAKNSLPSDWNNGNIVGLPGSNSDPYIMEFCDMKYNYFDMMGIDLKAGVAMNNKNINSGGVWLNESAVKILNLSEPIGSEISINSKNAQIIGVFEDVRSKSLHIDVDPQVIRQMHFVEPYYPIFIKIKGNQKEAVNTIRKLWESVNPNKDFELQFLDEVYNDLYKAEIRTGKIVSWGMIIALFLTTIGLIALVTYSTQRRTKEIGLRKVNGASISDILILLNKDFIKWILLAFLIATPFSYYLMNNWLQQFAFRTNLSWWIYAISGLLVFIISILTVSWQSFKVTRKNPVEALKNE